MRGTHIRRAGLALAFALAVGCGDDDRSTGSELSRSVVSNVRVVPLTGQFAKRTIQYRITATVSNPGGVVGGTAQLTSGTAQTRRTTAQTGGPVLAKTAITEQNLVGGQLNVVLTLNGLGVGTHHVLFSVIDARGLESNQVPLTLGIRSVPPPRPPPDEPDDTFERTLGATFQHARCTSCHGFEVPNQTGTNHLGRSPVCSNCHSVTGWHAPDASFNLAGLSKTQICNLVKTKQGNNATAIENHLKDDPLIQWAISDAITPDNVQRQKAPPGNLGAWNSLIDDWVDDGLKCN
jgi:hypothetical protein